MPGERLDYNIATVLIGNAQRALKQSAITGAILRSRLPSGVRRVFLMILSSTSRNPNDAIDFESSPKPIASFKTLGAAPRREWNSTKRSDIVLRSLYLVEIHARLYSLRYVKSVKTCGVMANILWCLSTTPFIRHMSYRCYCSSSTLVASSHRDGNGAKRRLLAALFQRHFGVIERY